ncbi:MAG: hypothetical protein LH629_12250, partial [Ignavibacteria bacterium]|nr:hypothetical protein [Ignavibacteria bacterium]
MRRYIKMNNSSYNAIVAKLSPCGLLILVTYYLSWNDIWINIGLAWAVISILLFLIISFLVIKSSIISIKCVLVNFLYSFGILLFCVFYGLAITSSVKINFIYGEGISNSFEIENGGVITIIDGKDGKYKGLFRNFHEGELKLNYTKDGVKNFYVISGYVTGGSVFAF